MTDGSSITSVEQTEDKEHIEVNREDHTSILNSLWLRAQDVLASLNVQKHFEEMQCGGEVHINIPGYDYVWARMTDLPR